MVLPGVLPRLMTMARLSTTSGRTATASVQVLTLPATMGSSSMSRASVSMELRLLVCSEVFRRVLLLPLLMIFHQVDYLKLKRLISSTVSESSQKQAPLCNDIAPRIVTSSKKSSSNITCGCTKEATVMGLDGNPRGGCTPPRE